MVNGKKDDGAGNKTRAHSSRPGPKPDLREQIKVRVTAEDIATIVRMHKKLTGIDSGPEEMSAILLHLAVVHAPHIASLTLKEAINEPQGGAYNAPGVGEYAESEGEAP